MLLFIAHQQGMGVGQAITIDGETTILLTQQYENFMIGSDFDNSKWDIL